jgi:hypothetical protein
VDFWVLTPYGHPHFGEIYAFPIRVEMSMGLVRRQKFIPPLHGVCWATTSMRFFFVYPLHPYNKTWLSLWLHTSFLKAEAKDSSETLVTTYEIKRCHNSGDRNLKKFVVSL